MHSIRFRKCNLSSQLDRLGLRDRVGLTTSAETTEKVATLSVATFSLLAPRAGLEPTTWRLTAARSTIELSGNMRALAAGPGFEPEQTAPKAVVLPLHNPAIWPVQSSSLAAGSSHYFTPAPPGRNPASQG